MMKALHFAHMDALLVANTITSAMLILTCWWLAHVYASTDWPYGRTIEIR